MKSVPNKSWMAMRARGQGGSGMSNLHPSNKATSGATAFPMDQPAEHEKPIKIKLPPGLNHNVGEGRRSRNLPCQGHS